MWLPGEVFLVAIVTLDIPLAHPGVEFVSGKEASRTCERGGFGLDVGQEEFIGMDAWIQEGGKGFKASEN